MREQVRAAQKSDIDAPCYCRYTCPIPPLSPLALLPKATRDLPHSCAACACTYAFEPPFLLTALQQPLLTPLSRLPSCADLFERHDPLERARAARRRRARGGGLLALHRRRALCGHTLDRPCGVLGLAGGALLAPPAPPTSVRSSEPVRRPRDTPACPLSCAHPRCTPLAQAL